MRVIKLPPLWLRKFLSQVLKACSDFSRYLEYTVRRNESKMKLQSTQKPCSKTWPFLCLGSSGEKGRAEMVDYF